MDEYNMETNEREREIPQAPVESTFIPEQKPPVPPTPRVPWDMEGEPKKTPKKKSGNGKRILAAVLALVILAGSCMTTAGIVNSRWKKAVAGLESRVDTLQNELTSRIDDVNGRVNGSLTVGSGISTAGTLVTTDGLSPAQVYAQNVRSVVYIENEGTAMNAFGQTTTAHSSGSGFILTEDGYVVTNYHVIDGAQKLTVTTFDGTKYPATLIGGNEQNDVALVKIDGENLPAVKIGNSRDLIVGDMVVAIGYPLSMETATQTVGFVSALERIVNTENARIDMIQTDAAINSGNSGGPLFNMRGEVIGITSAKYSGSTGSGASIEGIGFAIPIDDVMGMIEDLQVYGYVTGAYLGVMVRNLDSSTAATYGLPTGVYVESVTEGSCAEKAGLQAQDIITGLGDYDLSSYEDLAWALRKFKAGDTTTISVYRGGQVLTLSITLDEKPHEEAVSAPAEENTMPQNGSYDEWYKYFFGKGNDGE